MYRYKESVREITSGFHYVRRWSNVLRQEREKQRYGQRVGPTRRYVIVSRELSLTVKLQVLGSCWRRAVTGT